MLKNTINPTKIIYSVQLQKELSQLTIHGYHTAYNNSLTGHFSFLNGKEV